MINNEDNFSVMVYVSNQHDMLRFYYDYFSINNSQFTLYIDTENISLLDLIRKGDVNRLTKLVIREKGSSEITGKIIRRLYPDSLMNIDYKLLKPTVWETFFKFIMEIINKMEADVETFGLESYNFSHKGRHWEKLYGDSDDSLTEIFGKEPIYSDEDEDKDTRLIPSNLQKKYGTDRNLTLADVRRIVKACRDYQNEGGSIEVFYHVRYSKNSEPPFSFETLRSWLKDKRFAPEA